MSFKAHQILSNPSQEGAISVIAHQTTDILGAGHSRQYKGLPDIEMNLLKDTNFFSSLVASERQDEIPKIRPWDDPQNQDRIFVNKDYSIRSEHY